MARIGSPHAHDASSATAGSSALACRPPIEELLVVRSAEAAGPQGPQASRFRPTNAGHLDNLIKFKSSSQGTKRMPPSLVLAPAWLALAAHMLTMRHPQRRVLRRSHVDSPSKSCWLSDREAAGRQGPQASRFRPTNAGRLYNLIKFKSSSQGTKRMPSSLVFAPAWLAMAVHMLAIRHPRRRFSSAARTSIGSTITSSARPALLPAISYVSN